MIGPSDLARMIACLEILSSSTSQVVTVALPGGEEITARGIGDPQAARAWLLQALTGRRVSEILMLDYDPLTAIPGLDPTRIDEGAFVARLRYQRPTLVDATILVITVTALRRAAAGRTTSIPKYCCTLFNPATTIAAPPRPTGRTRPPFDGEPGHRPDRRGGSC